MQYEGASAAARAACGRRGGARLKYHKMMIFEMKKGRPATVLGEDAERKWRGRERRKQKKMGERVKVDQKIRESINNSVQNSDEETSALAEIHKDEVKKNKAEVGQEILAHKKRARAKTKVAEGFRGDRETLRSKLLSH
uniref:Uncharacterized protein n=1 Tax=Cannabis sativa TaxID=3483 RepID=A0A803Q2U1_CANSA